MIINDLEKNNLTSPILAIGNFDGVHVGHKALLNKASAVMTFEPHPREFFQKNAAPFRLTLEHEKAELIKAQGVKTIFSLGFNAAFAGQTAHEFIDLIKQKINPEKIIVGADFAFGKGKEGTVKTLQDHFDVDVVAPVLCASGEVVSSSRIRAHLQNAEFTAAENLLGHPWFFESEVVQGNKQGRVLGYPTANQNFTRRVRLPYGVYVVDVKIEGENNWRRGAANFGIRPMFEISEPIFETFIFDYAEEIYGKKMKVKPLKYLRPEMKFENIEALKDQMKQDCIEARQAV